MTDEMMAPSSSETSDEPSAAYEEDADAVQEPGPAPLDVRQQARHGKAMGTGDAGGHGSPRTREEAQAALDYTSAFCRDCPERVRCREEACPIFNAEEAALAVLRAPVVAGVPLRGSIL